MTIFEKASSVVNNSRDATDMRENCIYWCDGDKFATVNVNGNGRYATRIRKLAEEHPEEARIFSDEKGGYLVAAIPVKAIKLNILHGNGKEWTEEEREVQRERMRALLEAKRNKANDT